MSLERWLAIGLGTLIGILVILLWVANLRLDRAQEEAAAWERSARTNQTALADMQAAYKATSNALAARERNLETLDRQLSSQRKVLKEAERHDKAVADWGRTPVPGAVLGVLQNGFGTVGNPSGCPRASD